MKKFSVLLTLAVLMVSSSVFAGSIDYLSNQSAKYVMNTARAASTDGADIAAYNPAGTALMGEGFFIDISNQTLLKYYTVKEDAVFKEEYEQNVPTYLLPNVYLAYNAGQIGVGKLAVYGQMGVTAGGGKLKYDDGSLGSSVFAYSNASTIAATIQAGVYNAIYNTYIAGGASVPVATAYATAGSQTTVTGFSTTTEASSTYYDFGAGVSYSFLEDMLSVSAGAKYVIAQRSGKVTGILNFNTVYAALGNYKIYVEDEWEYDAKGITPVFGFDVKPMKELTLGVKYEMETKLEFEYTQKERLANSTNAMANAQFCPGVQTQLPNYDKMKANTNLPQILSLGAEYAINPAATVGISSNIFFLSKADMEGVEDNFGTGYEVGISGSYKVIDPLKLGATFMYTNQGVKDDYLENAAALLSTSVNPILDSLWFGLGATYTVIPNLDITLAAGWVHYLPKDVKAGSFDITYEKEVYNVALGASYKI